MRVDIEEFNKHTEYFKKINNYKIEDLEIYENGIKIETNQENIDEFSFTGLSNMDFIYARWWEGNNIIKE